MPGPLSRFLKLERFRRDRHRSQQAGESKDQTRFRALRGPASGQEDPAATSEVMERFRSPPPPSAASEVGLAPPEPDSQPFVRCPRCEVDSSVYVRSCANCDAALDTPEVRAFNDRIWEARREQRATEAAVLSERDRQRQQAATEEAAARRQWATEAAREIRDRVERELEPEQGLSWLVALLRALGRHLDRLRGR